MRTNAITALGLVILSGPLRAQVVATSGGYQLTEQMLAQALQFGQILAGAEFSPGDAASLRRESWLDLALDRYRVWQGSRKTKTPFVISRASRSARWSSSTTRCS